MVSGEPPSCADLEKGKEWQGLSETFTIHNQISFSPVIHGGGSGLCPHDEVSKMSWSVGSC